jgi:hypothetical protein
MLKPQELFISSSKRFWAKWALAFRVVPTLILVGGLKYLAYHFGYEVMELNALFTTLVAGTIFLLGFLISGVLSDYKESEKIPAEISATIRTMIDDCYTLYKAKDIEEAKDLALYLKDTYTYLIRWMYKKIDTDEMLSRLRAMNDYFIAFEKKGATPNIVIKIKQEQNYLRKMILRIETIRDTNFVSSAYTIVEFMGLIIALGLIITKIDPFYFGVALSMMVTFLITYMFYLIKDIDNPFDYSEKGESGTEISLEPLHKLKKYLDEINF